MLDDFWILFRPHTKHLDQKYAAIDGEGRIRWQGDILQCARYGDERQAQRAAELNTTVLGGELVKCARIVRTPGVVQ